MHWNTTVRKHICRYLYNIWDAVFLAFVQPKALLQLVHLLFAHFSELTKLLYVSSLPLALRRRCALKYSSLCCCYTPSISTFACNDFVTATRQNLRITKFDTRSSCLVMSISSLVSDIRDYFSNRIRSLSPLFSLGIFHSTAIFAKIKAQFCSSFLCFDCHDMNNYCGLYTARSQPAIHNKIWLCQECPAWQQCTKCPFHIFPHGSLLRRRFALIPFRHFR